MRTKLRPRNVASLSSEVKIPWSLDPIGAVKLADELHLDPAPPILLPVLFSAISAKAFWPRHAVKLQQHKLLARKNDQTQEMDSGNSPMVSITRMSSLKVSTQVGSMPWHQLDSNPLRPTCTNWIRNSCIHESPDGPRHVQKQGAARYFKEMSLLTATCWKIGTNLEKYWMWV